MDQIIHYLYQHKEIKEFIFSGGDPLMESPSSLNKILSSLKKTKIEYVRFHTRVPILLPSKITKDLLKILKYHKKYFKIITLVLHINEKSELTQRVKTSINKLLDLNLLLRLQTVLLKNINDDAKKLSSLFLKVSEMGIIPYYLHHPDKVYGAMHFYVEESLGRKIYLEVKKITPTWALPHYVVQRKSQIEKSFVLF